MNIFHEIKYLRGNTKGIFFLCFFRLSSYFTKNIFFKIIGLPIRIIYKLLIQWILGIDIPDVMKAGSALNVYHGQGLVINEATIFGNFVTIRQNTTIGNAKQNGKCPIIGNKVNIGANTVIIGDIKIGDNVIIGAGSVVVDDIPENSVVVGNPARIIKKVIP